jgi:hypothetical protein
MGQPMKIRLIGTTVGIQLIQPAGMVATPTQPIGTVETPEIHCPIKY